MPPVKAADTSDVSTSRITETPKALFPPFPYVATAYSLGGRTQVAEGLVEV